MKNHRFIFFLVGLVFFSHCGILWEEPAIEKEIPIYTEFTDDVRPCSVFAYLNLDIQTADGGWYLTYDSEIMGAQEIRHDTAVFSSFIKYADTCFIHTDHRINGYHYTGSTEVVWPQVASKMKIKGLKLDDRSEWDTLDNHFHLHVTLQSLSANSVIKNKSFKFNFSDFNQGDSLIFENPVTFPVFDNREDIKSNEEIFHFSLNQDYTEEIYVRSVFVDNQYRYTHRNTIVLEQCSPRLYVLVDWLP